MEREKNVRSTHTATKPINRQIATQCSLLQIHSMNSGSFHDNKRFFLSSKSGNFFDIVAFFWLMFVFALGSPKSRIWKSGKNGSWQAILGNSNKEKKRNVNVTGC